MSPEGRQADHEGVALSGRLVPVVATRGASKKTRAGKRKGRGQGRP